MYKTTIGIDGMACGMCESHIKDVIRKNFDIKKVTASASKNMAEIISEGQIPEDKLHEAIDPTGYTVTSYESGEYVKKGLFGR